MTFHELYFVKININQEILKKENPFCVLSVKQWKEEFCINCDRLLANNDSVNLC